MDKREVFMTDTITSDNLFQAILYGAVRTEERKDDLNRINVFPVVDNDTGSNLAHTMHFILSHSKAQASVRSTLKDVARSALIGARGNSGAIFSQYFNGLYLRSPDKAYVTLSEMAVFFQEAFDKAYHAIDTPVEGTIITLMRAWSVSFRESLEERKSMREIFETSLLRIKVSLEETTNTLEALRKLRIVDAGALGYYYFMDGFVQSILGLGTKIQPYEAALPTAIDADIHNYGETSQMNFRYCTEVLIEAESMDLQGFHEELTTRGDCLLISSTDNLTRIHLHTNEPWEIVRLASLRGRLLEQKADDMIHQNLLAGPFENKIACVTDSVADLPQEYVFEHNIFQIPVNIMVERVSYLDKVTIDSAFLNEHLADASTSQINSEQIRNFLEPILSHYSQVVILTVSSHMSGTYSRFKETLADMQIPDSKAVLIDTRVNSGAQGLLVLQAVQMIEQGLSFPHIVSALEAMRSRAKILVSVLDIEMMAHSGRVSEKIGDLLIRLKFKPLISIDPDGKGTIKGVAFSFSKNRKILLKSMRGKHVEDYCLVHAAAPERVESLRQDMIRITGKLPLYTTEISSAVTLFAGKGSVAVAYLEKIS